MSNPTRTVDPAAKGPNVYYEADIGSGEKSPAELETEEMIREIPPLPHSGSHGGQTGQTEQRQSEQRPAGNAERPRG